MSVRVVVRRGLLLAAIGLVAGCGLVVGLDDKNVDSGDAGSDANVVGDARDENASDAIAVDASDGAIDAGPPPRCDRAKPFGVPKKLAENALDVSIDSFGSFRVDATETHAWLQRKNLVRQYTLSGTELTYDPTISVVGALNGFAVSPDGLHLLASAGGGFERRDRASVTANFGPAQTVLTPLTNPDGSSYASLYHPSFRSNPADFFFARFVYYPNASSTWDVYSAHMTDASTASATAQGELHLPNAPFTNEPTFADDLTLYFDRWGTATSYPRIARLTRTTPQSSWGTPSDVTVGALVVGPLDTVRVLSVTADECVMYFSYATAAPDASSLDGPHVLYVARRPP